MDSSVGDPLDLIGKRYIENDVPAYSSRTVPPLVPLFVSQPSKTTVVSYVCAVMHFNCLLSYFLSWDQLKAYVSYRVLC